MVVAEWHVGEEADFSFERRKQLFVERGIDQIPDQRRVAPKAVREGIVLQPLFLQIEQKGSHGETSVEEMGICGLSGFSCE